MSQTASAEREYRRSCRKYLEDLVARRDFQAACRYFDSIRDVWDGRSDLESGTILRLGAEAFGSSENLSKALTLIRTAISIFSRLIGETAEAAECYLVLGGILRDMGKFREAEKAFRDAESIFRRSDNLNRAGIALNRLAAIHFRKGEFNSSLKCLLEAIEYAKREKDNQKLAYLFGNIGRVHTLMGKLNQAGENIRFNIELSTELDDQVELARSYLSLGYVRMQQARYDEAEEALTTGRQYVEKNNMAKEEIIYLTYSGELMYKTGRLDESEVLLARAVTAASKMAPDSLLAARAMRQTAELLLNRGLYRKALQMANKSLALMKKLEDSVEIGALLRIQAECHMHLEDKKKARNAFVSSIATLEESRARFELADSLAAAGKCPAFGLSQRTMYLCRAEELYNVCGIDEKAMLIQKLIGNIELADKSDLSQLENADSNRHEFPTRNSRMKEIISHLRLLGNTDIPILFTGETGTGKDYLARYFHSIVRPDGPYVAINCAAVPETLIESELFGYHKGAFTGADDNRRGLFLAANNGVLLLDEIGELPLRLQAKLLSVLETKKLRPLGTAREIPLNLIVIAATNRNLYEMVEQNVFRQDLYYRLAGITFELPPLRERKEDIPHLLEFFMRKFGLLDSGQKPETELVRMFVGHDWPGNIRQMENKVKQLSVLASMAKEGSIVELSRKFFEAGNDSETHSLFEQVEQFEKRLLIQALVSANGNKSEAARLLAIHESTFRAKMKRYDLISIAS